MRLLFLILFFLLVACTQGRYADRDVFVCVKSNMDIEKLVESFKNFGAQEGLLYGDSADERIYNLKHLRTITPPNETLDNAIPTVFPVSSYLYTKRKRYPAILSNFGRSNETVALSYFYFPKQGFDESFAVRMEMLFEQSGFTVVTNQADCKTPIP